MRQHPVHDTIAALTTGWAVRKWRKY